MAFVAKQFPRALSCVTFDEKSDLAVAFCPEIGDHRAVTGVTVYKCKKNAKDTAPMSDVVVNNIFKLKVSDIKTDGKTRMFDMTIQPLARPVRIQQTKGKDGNWKKPKILYQHDDGRWITVLGVSVTAKLNLMSKCKVYMKYKMKCEYRVGPTQVESVEIKNDAPPDFSLAMYEFFQGKTPK